MEQKEDFAELCAEIRRDTICAINRKDIQSYMSYAQELVIAAGELDEAGQKEIGIFLMLCEKTFHEFKGAN
jgi:hypothetical protein